MLSERVQRQVDRLLDAAEEAVSRFDWPAVRENALAVLRLDPDNPDARTFLAAAERDAPPAAPAGAAEPGATPLGAVSEGVSPRTPTPSPQTLTPSSFCDGRYEVKRFLGEGGKKRVYLAHDTKLDRDVAFALIKTDGLDAESLLRIRREAQAMGRLGDHPHIVAVYDIGEENGQPYLVSQLMAGGDVEVLLQKSPNHRIPLDTTLLIADQVCQALEYAHGRGIIHRDLKPGNVWLTGDPDFPSPASSHQLAPVAKLGDFGLAVALDRSRLTQAGMMVGTVHYMPPEQALGGEVTARSDLYALGAMLYEMVVGRPPFVGDESVAIITQHLNTPPVSPSWHVPDLPPGLEVLILRLLEKDPAKRPGSATEVRQVLGAVAPTPTLREGPTGGDSSALPVLGEGSGVRASSPGPSPSTQPATPDPLYRRTFVGREQELRQLQGAYDRAISGQGSLLAVVGEPGIGKTALCEQLATYAAVRGGRTLVGHCYEEGSLSLPYLAFVEAIRAYVIDRPPDALKEELGSGAADVARIVSEVRQRLSLDPTPSGGGDGVGAADPDEERWRLLQAVTGFLRNASAVQPLLIVLEDLHWADRGTLDLLVYLARNLQGGRLLLVGTYRDVEVDRTHPLSAALAELRRISAFDRLLLRGLSAQDVQHMLAAITGQDVRWGFAEAVHRQTEGNPLFVQEVVRYLAEEGLIKHEGGRWQRTGSAPLEMSIPEGLRDVIGRRLSRLSADCNRVLTLASVIGRDFTLHTLRTVVDLPEDPLLQTLEEAVRVGVLEERERVGGADYRFAHAFFRQTLYEEISVPRRLQLHQRVGRALEAGYGARLAEHAAELADHFAHSSDRVDLAKAVEYGEMAARRAMSVFAYSEAARLLEQAIEVQEVLDPDEKARRCDLLLALAKALGPAGEPRRVAEEVARDAFALAEALGDSERAGHAAEQALDAQRRFAFGAADRQPMREEWVDRLDRYATPGTARRVAADLQLANQDFRRGRWNRAWERTEQALTSARQVGSPDVLFRAATSSMNPWLSARQWPKALQVAQEFRSVERLGVSSHTLADFLIYSWGTFIDAGERELAEEQARELDNLGTRNQDPILLLAAALPAATATLLDGEIERAVEDAHSILVRAEELGSPAAGESMASRVGFRPLFYLGRFEEAVTGLELGGSSTGVFNLGQCLASMAHIRPAAEIRARLWEALRGLDLTEMEDDVPIRALAGFLETAVILQDQAAAALLTPKLVSVPGMWWPPTSVALHVAGGFALAGDREAARIHYARALEWTTRIRHRPEVALTRLGLAELLMDGRPDEQAEAQEHLDFAIDEFRAMKMQPSLERALRHKGLLHA